MADGTAIEWTRGADGRMGATWNPIAGCSILSPGCINCYAMDDAHRLANNPNAKIAEKYAGTTKRVKGKPVWTGRVNIANDNVLLQPLRWREPRLIFVNSMADLFHDSVPDAVIDRIFAVMALCPQHIFQVLTKRSARMRRYCTYINNRDDLIADAAVDIARRVNGNSESLHRTIKVAVRSPLPNVWLGVSAEDQTRYEERRDDLRDTPAAVRWWSMEPLLGPIVADWLGDWVVVGGESGPHARPMHPQWARSIRDLCAAARVPFFFKQWGEWRHAPERAHFKEAIREPWMRLQSGIEGVRPAFVVREGKKPAGRLLDGREHNAMPVIAERVAA